MDAAELLGRRLALVAIDQDQPDGEAAVFAGRVIGFGVDLVVSEEAGTRTFVVPHDWLPRIQPIEDAGVRKTLLESDAVILLACEPMPDDADESEHRATGLQWPGEG